MRRLGAAAVPTAAAFVLSACVTTADSPVTPAFTGYCAPPAVEARLTDPDGLPALYDAALGPYVPDGPRTGAAVRFVEASLTDGLTAAMADGFTGDADCALSVAVENVILPDRTRFTPLSGQKSFLVRAALTAPDGAVLAETTRPFTILAEHQKRGRLGGSAWRRIGNTQDLRDALRRHDVLRRGLVGPRRSRLTGGDGEGGSPDEEVCELHDCWPRAFSDAAGPP